MTSQLAKWYEKNKGKDFELVMANYDRTEKAMYKYLNSKKVSFPAIAFKNKNMKSVGQHGSGYLPCLSVIDENGKAVVKDGSLADVEKKLGIKK